LSRAGAYATGGLGGQTAGSAADHLSSQGSLGYDPRDGLVVAVNAGSNTVSVFGIRGDRLSLHQVICDHVPPGVLSAVSSSVTDLRSGCRSPGCCAGARG